jgi:hypothetical protein
MLKASVDDAVNVNSNSVKSLDDLAVSHTTEICSPLIHHLPASAQITDQMASQVASQASLFQESVFGAHLQPRLVALAGAQLDTIFLSMSPDVIEEEETESISLSIDSRSLQGVRYDGEVYRLVEQFSPCHRLQAFCLGHTFNEQLIAHIITRSPERFAVWVNIRALPHVHYHSYLP